MVKREAVKGVENQKLHMISALYANSAFDESEAGIKERAKRIEGIDEHFNRAIEMIYDPTLGEGKEIDWENPFWQAARRAQQRRIEMARGQAESASVGEVVEQEPARRMLPEYDQS
jgi:hypothetical protein